jgi:hypothetical protein
MAVWQYAQLAITVDCRLQEPTRAILWHGPDAGIDGDLPESEQTVLEMLNQLGADGWELAGVEKDKQGGRRDTDWGATWSLTTYIFKRQVGS